MPSIEYMSMFVSDQNMKNMRQIKTVSYEVFEYEGYIFKGTPFAAKIEFFFLNPEGGDFLKWLKENRKIVAETTP